jgi:hypothetical protein
MRRQRAACRKGLATRFVLDVAGALGVTPYCVSLLPKSLAAAPSREASISRPPLVLSCGLMGDVIDDRDMPFRFGPIV